VERPSEYLAEVDRSFIYSDLHFFGGGERTRTADFHVANLTKTFGRVLLEVLLLTESSPEVSTENPNVVHNGKNQIPRSVKGQRAPSTASY